MIFWNQTLSVFHATPGNNAKAHAMELIGHLKNFLIRTGAVVAEVDPGDMLVVPPFWYHHVETLQESVSVNVWSDALEYALINKM